MVGQRRRGWNPGGLWPESPRAPNQLPAVQSFDAAGKLLHAAIGTGYTDSSDDGVMMNQNLTLTFRKDAGCPRSWSSSARGR